MKRLVIDIETVGTPWEDHDPYVREYLIKGKSEAEAEEEKRRGALSPFTGRIVAIGVINADDGRSCALFEVPGQSEVVVRRDGPRTFISGTEELILKKFWEFLGEKDRFISFNGRQFDGPFLMIRSAINGITPKRDLVGYRYSFHPNCDLREALNFWGSVNSRQYRFNLDLACKTFGVKSSKSEGMDGRAVEMLYREGRYEEIATYCLEDVRATAELYHKLAPTLLCWESSFRDAEARMRARSGRPDATQESLLVPSSEQPFLDSIAEGSELLASALADDELSPAAAFEHQPGRLLGKLLDTQREEDDAQALPDVER
ncbi:MAG TPA: ribonuclease H-like domain-containing protein [Thermoanaerobaculia bacterium]|nr:ribonuclease H-like domain-containing protein [Thermoanaerobaculia bacterium]